MRSIRLTPWILGGLVVAVAFALGQAPEAPQPTTIQNVEVLRAEVADLERRARTVDPIGPEADAILTRVPLIAAELDRVGLAPEAGRVRGAGFLLETRRAAARVIDPRVPPPPGGGIATPPRPDAPNPAPSVLPADVATVVATALADDRDTTSMADRIADRIEQRFPGSFFDTIQKLRAHAKKLRADQPAPTVAEAMSIFRRSILRPGSASPTTLDAIADQLQTKDATAAAMLRQHAMTLRARDLAKLGLGVPA